LESELNVLIFDLDGVIINSGADIANAVNHTRRLFGLPLLSNDEIISYVGNGAEALIRRSFKDCSEDLIQKALPLNQQYYLDNALIETSLYPNVKETLEDLKERRKDIKIALVTNKPEAITEKILAGLGVRQYFDLIVGPESVKNMKPDPEGIIKVLNMLDRSPEQAVMIGDSYIDIEAGRRAGTKTCGAAYGLGDKEELIKSNPDFVINNINEVIT